MIKILIIAAAIILGLLVFWCISNKVKIKWKTFLKRGFSPKRGNFGVYCYTGKQGKGKTYSIVEYLIDNKDNIITFCNIADINNFDYFYFTGFDELIKLKAVLDYNYSDIVDLKDYILSLGFDYERTCQIVDMINDFKNHNKQLVFVYDEIFTELQRYSKVNKQVMDFLCQMRKRKIIFLTTAQEWPEIPLTFRRFCRYQINCRMINFFGLGLLFKEFNDAENMKWSDELQEHIAPLIETTLTKCRKFIADSYNTYLRVSSVVVQPTTEEKSKNDVPVIDLSFWDNIDKNKDFDS